MHWMLESKSNNKLGLENPMADKRDGTSARSPLERRLLDLLNRRVSNSTLRKLTLPQKGQVDFSSNDFLSLSTSEQLKAAFLEELQRTGLPQGSGGSRLLDGNSEYAEALEREIARFHGAEAGLLFNSGFDANAGFFACVPQAGDVIVYDELVHASVHDGMRLSRAAKTIPFKHNSVNDLTAVLQGLAAEDEGERNTFVAVESIYSMDGDVAPLKEIVAAVEGVVGVERSYVVVDEAHSTGVLGPQGRGLVCDLGLEHRIFARLHTFGKALASNGGALSSLFLFQAYTRLTTRTSHLTRLKDASKLFDQLCAPTDIHNLLILSCSCTDSIFLHTSLDWQDSRSARPLTLPHAKPLRRSDRIMA
jgi:7-keto-8-aminopelargonate synthetase-like enzyme